MATLRTGRDEGVSSGGLKPRRLDADDPLLPATEDRLPSEGMILRRPAQRADGGRSGRAVKRNCAGWCGRRIGVPRRSDPSLGRCHSA